MMMLTTLLLTGTDGHGALLHPTPRNFPETTGVRLFPPSDDSHLWHKFSENYWYNQGCQIGCGECDQLCNPESAGAGDPAELGGHDGPCCANPMEPTLPDELRTWNENELQQDILNGHTSHGADMTKYNPWRAPGYAPVIDSCGVGGGALWKPENITNYGSIGNDGVPPPGFPHGVYGTQLPASENIQTWKAGEVVELMWSPLIANHGGGYQYRLCPTGKAAEGGEAAEECFQAHPLEFVGDSQWIQYLGNKDFGRYEIPATRVTEGVKPAGAAWTRNPFPPCEGISGGEATHLCKAPMFEPPAEMGEDWFGYGLSRCQIAAVVGSVDSSCDQEKWFAMQDFYNFGIVDKVKIPDDLPAGSYVMSWRWDVEQSPQVWANCADVRVSERPKFGGRDDDSVPNPHFELEATLKAGCGFACKSSSDCSSLCGVCNDGFCQAQARQTLKAGCGFACKSNADCTNNSFDTGCGFCNDGFCEPSRNSFERLMKKQPKLQKGCGFGCKSNADCDSPCGICNDGFCEAQASVQEAAFERLMKQQPKLQKGCGFGCKSNADCDAPCGICNDGFCEAQALEKEPVEQEPVLGGGCGYAFPCKRNSDCEPEGAFEGKWTCGDCVKNTGLFGPDMYCTRLEKSLGEEPMLEAGCGFACASDADCNNNSFDSGCGVCNDGFCQAQRHKELKAPMRSQ